MIFRAPLSLLAAASFAVVMAGCGSNPNAPGAGALPSGTQPLAAPASRERMLGTLAVRAGTVRSISGLVLFSAPAAIYYGPGRPTVRTAGRPSAKNPKDLSYEGGPVLVRSTTYDLYVNCPDGSCWGDPGDFSARLGDSSYIHVADQYMKPKVVTADGRYTYAGGLYVPFSGKKITEADLQSMLHDAAAEYGGGLNHLYHVFVRKDTGLCTAENPTCKVDYCGYHSSIAFKDIGLVVYSVEPYQAASCLSPNKKLRDSTDSTLLHEIFEAITDPLVNDPNKGGWYNYHVNPETGSDYGEIADICDGDYGHPDIGPPSEQVQKVWSNARQSCTFEP